MQILPKPNKDAKAFFDLCISKRQGPALKRRLEGSATAIETASNNFDAKGEDGEFHKLTHVTNLPASDQELYKVYDYGCRSGRPGRDYYDQLLLSSPKKVCTLCWRREADTLDHYLPRSQFQEFSVTPNNLIPACSKCNQNKGTHVPTCYEDQFIHPYFDDLSTDRWLYGEAREVEGATVVTFYIKIPTDWEKKEMERLSFHFNKFGLWESYAISAAVGQEDIIAILCCLACLNDADKIQSFLEDMAQMWCAKNPNTWKTALYFALAEHEPFITREALNKGCKSAS